MGGFLNATREALRPDNSYWYIIDHKYLNNQWTYK